ncbi:uncharacterized protein LOC34619136 [Cyclospora cayetanensis]|uniref:Uncharacterized protein LOC34619136 n=1 Tax=Cyclospora cayetanensis TaxID=88456 RepID=A0A6P6S096_9EIME|nr:uncharacterized protein LOC34619136 [Cyclospora cayetanensis]
MPSPHDDGGLDRLSRALRMLKKDVDLLYDPRELPTHDNALFPMPGRTKDSGLSTPVASLPRRPRNSHSPSSPRGAARRRLEASRPSLGGANGRLNTTSKQIQSSEESDDEGEERETARRYSGTVKVSSLVDETLAAGGLAAAASAARLEKDDSMRCRVMLEDDASFSSVSSNEEEEKSEGNSPRNTREGRGSKEGPYHGLAAANQGSFAPRNSYYTPSFQQQNGYKGSVSFPPPHSAAEMQRRLEEEWGERERRLRLQHQRHTETVVAQEIEKVTQEFGRRLIYELQQQEALLQQQFQQQNTHAQLKEATESNWRLHQKTKELQEQLDTEALKQKHAETEIELLQRETQVGKIHRPHRRRSIPLHGTVEATRENIIDAAAIKHKKRRQNI